MSNFTPIGELTPEETVTKQKTHSKFSIPPNGILYGGSCRGFVHATHAAQEWAYGTWLVLIRQKMLE